ncbi:MAG: hypothetical protein ABSD68_02235 [Candidatus Micrarchaeales archaeon]|jgi:phosphate uptake regulator
MEKHIFKFGENSVAMIVPKKWVDKNGLKPSSMVFISENESGGLVISASETLKAEADRTVNQRAGAASIGRWVGLHYMFGTGKMHIHSEDSFTQAQVEAVENKISAECPGFEITSQSKKDIIIEDLMDIKEVDLGKIAMRLHSLINQEFKEMSGGDPQSVAKIEKLVNRFYMLGMRYVSITQAKDAFVYATQLNLLESISDNLDLLASNIGGEGMRVFNELNKQFDACFLAFNGDEKAIEEVLVTREPILKQIQRLKIDHIYKYLLRSIADSSSNIAELGFKRRNPYDIPVLKATDLEVKV